MPATAAISGGLTFDCVSKIKLTYSKNIFSRLKGLATGNLSLFLFANALYSLSTGLINISAPWILDVKIYEDFIYVFQNVMLLTSICATGIVPTLLRFHKYSQKKYDNMFYWATFGIIGFLLICGLSPNNILSKILRINRQSYIENLLIYISVIFQLLYIFNRGVLTARNRFVEITKGIVVIFVLRVIALFIIAELKIDSFNLILASVGILPFINELIVYIHNFIAIKAGFSFGGYWKFLFFAAKVSIIGILTGLTSQIFIVHTKDISDSMAAALSFSAGLIGIIGIFNATMNSYFIGKLDARHIDSIKTYLRKIKRFGPIYVVALSVICLSVSYLVNLYYPSNSFLAAMFCFITIFKAGLWFFLCMTTLLAKTLNMLNIQVILNLACFCFVFILTKMDFWGLENIIGQYIIVCSIILINESLVAFCVVRKVLRTKRIESYNAKELL